MQLFLSSSFSRGLSSIFCFVLLLSFIFWNFFILKFERGVQPPITPLWIRQCSFIFASQVSDSLGHLASEDDAAYASVLICHTFFIRKQFMCTFHSVFKSAKNIDMGPVTSSTLYKVLNSCKPVTSSTLYRVLSGRPVTSATPFWFVSISLFIYGVMQWWYKLLKLPVNEIDIVEKSLRAPLVNNKFYDVCSFCVLWYWRNFRCHLFTFYANDSNHRTRLMCERIKG